MVDEMVRLATTGHIGLGFQRIFECAEAMKVVSKPVTRSLLR